MASAKASRRPLPADMSKTTTAPVKDSRKFTPSDATGVAAENGEVQEETPEPVATGDLRLALTAKSPSFRFLNDVRMDRLMDKLMLLGYTAALPRTISGTGISKNYFFDERPDQAVGRFHVFATLAVWMIAQLGVDLKTPTDRDDPNVTVQTISESLRTLGVKVETVPHRLKTANGADVVAILYELACLCLKKKEVFLPNFETSFKKKNEETEEEMDDQVEEEYDVIPLFNWEQEEVADDLNDNDVAMDETRQGTSDRQTKERLAEEWRLEADRLGPLFGRADGGLTDRTGWSDRVKKLDACRKELNENAATVEEKVTVVTSEISRSVEKIHNREKYISVNHRHKVERYRAASAKLLSAKTRYEAHNAEVEGSGRRLAVLTEEFDKLRRRVEEKGGVTDNVTLSGMKGGMKRMKEEMGVVSVKWALAEMRLEELMGVVRNAQVEEVMGGGEVPGVLPNMREY